MCGLLGSVPDADRSLISSSEGVNSFSRGAGGWFEAAPEGGERAPPRAGVLSRETPPPPAPGSCTGVTARDADGEGAGRPKGPVPEPPVPYTVEQALETTKADRKSITSVWASNLPGCLCSRITRTHPGKETLVSCPASPVMAVSGAALPRPEPRRQSAI